VNATKLKFDLRSVLEQIIQLSAFPKTLMTFTFTILQNNEGGRNELKLFSALVNAAIVLLNQAGINMRGEQYAALTLRINLN